MTLTELHVKHLLNAEQTQEFSRRAMVLSVMRCPGYGRAPLERVDAYINLLTSFAEPSEMALLDTAIYMREEYTHDC